MRLEDLDLSELDIDRFTSRLQVNPRTGCVLWTGYVSKKGRGYGEIKIAGYPIRAHRLAWLLAGNEIPDDKPNVLHNCPSGDNRLCCNPEHLWVGTHADNQKDKARKGRGIKSKRGLPYGVKISHGKRFEAHVRVDSRYVYLGSYDTADEAGKVADAARRERFECLS